jgi:HTH-type transcriptional repressor of NAD biosynthesis genes
MTTGVILGSFMPPHEGHVALIRTASHLVDRLTIIISASDNDPIPPAVRKHWMQQLFPKAPVFVQNSGAERLASDDPVWTGIIRAFHPEKIDRVIGSEAYIVPLAAALQAQHFILDPMWMALPANSSDIRRDPFGHWQSIPGLVRPWYQKRLTMVGGESTGKSWMAKFLAEKFGGPYVPEYGRPYEKFRKPGPYRAEELHWIVDGHEAHRKTLARNAGPILFEDTDALLTAVWAEMLLGQSLPDLEARIVLPDHYLLLDHNVAWENDPIRYFGKAELRKEFFDKTLAKLTRHGASWTLVDGDYAQREARAIEVTRAMMKSPKLTVGSLE